MSKKKSIIKNIDKEALLVAVGMAASFAGTGFMFYKLGQYENGKAIAAALDKCFEVDETLKTHMEEVLTKVLETL